MAAVARRRLDQLRGAVEPRLWTPPLRPLNRDTSRGFAAIDFARYSGHPYLPWQEWLSIHALELTPDGRYRFRIVLVIIARQNGKSTWKRNITLFRLFLDGAGLVVGMAQELSTADDQWQQTLDVIKEHPELSRELAHEKTGNSGKSYRLTSGGTYVTKAANRRAARGLAGVAEVNFDELREQRNWAAWSAVSKTTTANPNGQVVAMSNAGDFTSVVLNQLRGAGHAGLDPSIGVFEWSAEDGCALDDWDQIAQANPSLGHTISVDAIRTSMVSDPPSVFRTEVLCQQVDAIDDVVDKTAWEACRDAAGSLSTVDRELVAVCFDAAEDGTHATLAGAAVMPDGRVRTAIIRAWRTTADARDELSLVLDDVGANVVAWFPDGPAAELRHIFEGRDDVHPLSGGRQAAACQGLVGIVRARRILHPADPLQTAHVLGVRKIKVADGYRFVRRIAGAEGAGLAPADGAYATAGAIYLAQVMPEPVRSGIRSLG